MDYIISKSTKRIVAWLMSICMIFSAIQSPIPVRAEEISPDQQTIGTETKTETKTETEKKAETETKTEDKGNGVSGHTVTIPNTDPLADGYAVAPDSAYVQNEDRTYTVEDGSSFSFAVAITDGFTATTAVKANGVQLTAAEAVYTIPNITEDQNITVEGVIAEAGYNVELPKEQEGYSINPVDDSKLTVTGGGYFRFKIELQQDYSQSVPVVKSEDNDITADENGVYGIENIQSDISVTITGITKDTKVKSLLKSMDAVDPTAASNVTNLALGKAVTIHLADGTVDPGNSVKPGSLAVNGTKTFADYCEFGADGADDSRYLQLDLGRVQPVEKINMWRYFQDGRTYKGSVIVLYKNDDFSDPKIVYNSDDANKHGLGVGTDAKYAESEAGKSFTLAETTDARYIRVYMNGSDKGTTNHIIELEVMGVSSEYIASPLTNAAVYQDFPTHYQDKASNKNSDGSLKHVGGQVTHPDIVYVKEGWKGYKYWILYTPNVMKTSQYENPYVAASNDGVTWVEPNGISNPIEPEPVSTRFHNCDGDMVYNPEMDAMMAYWNWADDQGGGVGSEARLRISYDGIHWGVPSTYDEETGVWTKPKDESERTLKPATTDKDGLDNSFITSIASKERYNMLSPTFTYDSNRKLFVMWANNARDIGYYNGQKNFVETRISKDGINWSEPVKVKNFLATNEAGAQIAPWHQDISYIKEFKEYWALSQCFTGGAPDGSMLYLTKSKDGINWEQAGKQPVLNPGAAGKWDDFQIYRSTFLFDTEGVSDPRDGKLRVWYAALQDKTEGKQVIDSSGNMTITATSEDTRIWRIGYTENTYANIMKALKKDESYEIPGLVAGESLTLSADGVLYPGQSTAIKASFTPAETSDALITYTSSDAGIAAVDGLGKVTAGAKAGTVKITGTTSEGLTGSVDITVREPEKKEIRYKVGHDRPMYLENYYWSDDPAQKDGLSGSKNYDDENRVDSPVMLWNTIPDTLKNNTVILLIAERSLNGTQSVKDWIKRNVELCNANKIPCAVQISNGETNSEQLIPLEYWRNLAKENEYLVGFNAAEMYNRFAGDNRQYVIDMIKLGVDNGVSMMWTDTNIFGTNGVLYDWLTKDEELSGVMKNNKEYISLMTKESYGSDAANTDALFLGLWLTDYIGNWGIASDWWHWQLDGNGSLFEGKSGGDGWKQCLTWPENMYTQDIVRAASQGATCFKSEAQWYSNATKGSRTPTYQYSVIPFLQKIVSGEIKIPTKKEMTDRTTAIVSGRKNWNNFNYDTKYSNLYPQTARYGLIPYVPDTFPAEAVSGFKHVIKEPVTKAMMDKIYPTEKSQGNAWCENFGDTWYWMNSSEDKNVTQESTIETAINGSDSLNISSGPHNFAIIKETADKLNVYLSNYRIDKTELWDGTISDGLSDHGCYSYVWKMCELARAGQGKDEQLRDTIITVKNKVEPKVEFVTASPADRSWSDNNYVRPYSYTVAQKEGSADEWVINVKHNGIVELNITTGNPEVVVDSITLSEQTMELEAGNKKALTAVVKPDEAADKRLTWTSSDSRIASVDEKGMVIGYKTGSVKIRASLTSFTSIYAECKVNVKEIPATGITLDKSSVSLKAGETASVAAVFAPENTSDKTITWTSSNEDVATVKEGKITGLKTGSAVVTADTKYGVKAMVLVNVNYESKQTIQQNTLKATASSTQNGEGTIEGFIDGNPDTYWHSSWSPAASAPHWLKVELPEVQRISKISYLPRKGLANGTIYDYEVRAVDADGTETSVKTGSFDYTGYTDAARTPQIVEFNSVNAKAIILVAKKTKSNGSIVDATTGTTAFASCAEFNVYKDVAKPSNQEILDTIKALPTVKEADPAVTLPVIDGWTFTVIDSDHLDIIDATGKLIKTPEAATEVTLDVQVDGAAARAAGTAVSKKLPVMVAGSKVEVSKIAFAESSYEMELGQDTVLGVNVFPGNATDKSITFSSDADTVEVDQNGTVTAKKVGTATVTATSANGKTAECTVSVVKKINIVTSITVEPASKTMVRGETITLQAAVAPAEATDKSVRWTSSNPAVAKVDKSGKVTAAAAGTAVITAMASSGLKADCTIMVEVPVTGINLNMAALELAIGENYNLIPQVAPADATNKSVTWSTSNAQAVDVVNGSITAKGEGTAVITAKTVNGLTAECKVTVKADMIPVTSIALNSAKEYLLKGKSLQLKATVDPLNATNPSVTWTSSDDKVAAVDTSGNVSAKSKGTVQITASTSNGKTAACTIIVPEVKLNASSSVLQVQKSSSAVKVVSKYPADDKVASYQSSNTKIVKVDKKGKITAQSKTGKATITVTMASGASVSYKVTVQKGKVTTKKLSLDTKKITLLKGKKASVTTVRTPISATEKITYSTSNKKVATVDKKGKIKAVGSGTATITAKTSNGKKATCKVTVPGVTLKKSSASIKVKKTTSIKVKSTVVKGDKVKAYKSSNTKVASVSTKGVVKGIKKGKATITVTMKSGAATQFKVTVK